MARPSPKSPTPPAAPTARALLPGAVAASSIGLVLTAGLLAAYLVPLIIQSLTDELGIAPSVAGSLVTGMLLVSAIGSGLAAGAAAGRRRPALARAGLVVSAAGCVVAALVPHIVPVLAGMLAVGCGSGVAVATSSAALAAARDVDRMTSASLVINRLLSAAVLALVPILGGGLMVTFLALGGFALLMLPVVAGLPAAPAAASGSPTPVDRSSTIGPALSWLLLACIVVSALSEESLWAVSAVVAVGQVGLPELTVGLILSAAALTGLVGVLLVAVLGSRFGRAVPLAVLLVLGGICKFVAVTTTSGPVFIAAILAWSVWYPATITYLLALAASLQRAGRWAALAQSAYLCGATLAPLVGSSLGEFLGYHPTGWLLGGSSVLLAAPLAFLAHRADRRRPAEVTEATPDHESSGPAAAQHTPGVFS